MGMSKKQYIDRDSALKSVCYDCSLNENNPFCGIACADYERIKAIPAADVRPVVLCCDCKHFQVNVSPSGYLPQGVPEWECRHWCRPTDPTDFCSYGEKREKS